MGLKRKKDWCYQIWNNSLPWKRKNVRRLDSKILHFLTLLGAEEKILALPGL